MFEGSRKGIVIAVGEHSQKGKIRRIVDNAQEDCKTPLELKLEKIAKLIGYFGIGAGVVTLIALMIRFCISFSDELAYYKKASYIKNIITSILFNFPYLENDETLMKHVNNNLGDPRLGVAK